MAQTAPKPWYQYLDGSGQGDGPIGRPLPKANYCAVADLPGDPNFPAAISPQDYGGPGWLLAPIETAAIRDLSEINTILRIYEQQGKGLDYYDGTVWSIKDWANRLAQDWYGKPYDDLTDYDRRRQIRCAMLGASRKTYLLLYVANSEDIGQLSQTGNTFRGVTSSLLSGIAAASGNVILGIISAIYAAVAAVVAIATKDQLQSISDALLRGEEMDQTAQQAFCANFEQFFAINDVIWDSARQALVSATNDPEVTANLEQINATITQVVEQSQQGLELICGIIGGVELEPLDPEGPPLPAERSFEERVADARTAQNYSQSDLECQAQAAGAGWNYADRARYYANGVPWDSTTSGPYCGVNIKFNRRAAKHSSNTQSDNFLTQTIAGVPVWAALGVGWLLFLRRA